MRRLGGIWLELASFENLYLAYRKARRGKRNRADVGHFALDLERELLALQRELMNGEYLPGDYRLFEIYERKPRLIAAAPFRDRVVHHAVMNQVEPHLDRTFIADSYACRAGKGVHAAVNRYQEWSRRYAYVLKMDVSRYFPSIDRDILKEKLRRRIKDRRTLALLDLIIDRGPENSATALRYFPGDDLFTPLRRCTGLPIGNLTSQILANLYLDGLDHYLKHRCGARAYLRYVDDMVVLDNDKGRLAELREAVRERLAGDRLLLHPRKVHITPTRDGISLLGYVVFPRHRRLRSDNAKRFRRRARALASAYAEGRVDWQTVDASVQSWIGHAKHADTQALRRAILCPIVFRRGSRP